MLKKDYLEEPLPRGKTHSLGEKKSITLMKAELQTKNDDRFCGSERKNVQLQIITMKIIKAKAQKKYVIKQKLKYKHFKIFLEENKLEN